MPVLEPQPSCDLLWIEADGTTNTETWKLASCRHPVDMFVVHSQEFGQVGDFHRSMPGFEFLYQVETHFALRFSPCQLPVRRALAKTGIPVQYFLAMGGHA